jgi:peroxiredoxin
MTARVGQKAPDFTAPAYYQGKFVSIKLCDYLGKWVLLCFYRAILPLSERRKCRRSLTGIPC